MGIKVEYATAAEKARESLVAAMDREAARWTKKVEMANAYHEGYQQGILDALSIVIEESLVVDT